MLETVGNGLPAIERTPQVRMSTLPFVGVELIVIEIVEPLVADPFALP
jgi:hypothetical protein